MYVREFEDNLKFLTENLSLIETQIGVLIQKQYDTEGKLDQNFLE